MYKALGFVLESQPHSKFWLPQQGYSNGPVRNDAFPDSIEIQDY